MNSRDSRQMTKKSLSKTVIVTTVLGIVIIGAIIGIFTWQVMFKSSTTNSSSSQSTSSSSSSFNELPATYYVANNGNDSWSGSISSPNAQKTDGPFATLARAQVAVRNLKSSNPERKTPIVVQVEAGSYFLSNTLSFTSADSGTPNMQIVWESASNANVTVSGGKLITGFTRVSGNEWAASASGLQYFEQLWLNGQRIYRPRTTQGSYLYIASTVYSNYQSPNCSVPVGSQYECFDRFQFASGALNSSYYDMNNVEIYDFECWTVPILRLASVDTTNDTAFLTGTTSRNNMCHGFITGHRFLVENVREALNQPGEWYFDQPNNQILYIAAQGENPNTENFIAPQLTELIDANGLSYVTFHGFAFSNTNWVVPPSGWISPQGEGLTLSPVPGAINLTDSSYVTFDSCVISHASGYGMEIFGTGAFQSTSQTPYNNLIVNSALYDLGAGGILVGHPPSPSDTDANVAQYTLIQNNVIEGTGRFLPAGYGIYILNSHNNLVSHNLIYDTYANAIGAAGGTYESSINLPQLAHDNTIEFNLIYNVNQGVTQDGGAIYTANGPAQGNKILNNVVHDVTADLNASTGGYGGWGIYFDSTSQNVVAENNLVFRTSYPSIHQNDGFNNTVTNNILAYGNLGIIDRSHNNASSLTVTHNIIYWDINSAEGSFQRGIWTCSGTCASQFTFSNNLYWYLGGAPTFITAFPVKSYTLSQWQTSLGEDIGSMVANPMFANPSYPNDNYTLLAGSPALSVGFVPFNPNQAGRFASAILNPPAQQPAFPLQLLNPNTGF